MRGDGEPSRQALACELWPLWYFAPLHHPLVLSFLLECNDAFSIFSIFSILGRHAARNFANLGMSTSVDVCRTINENRALRSAAQCKAWLNRTKGTPHRAENKAETHYREINPLNVSLSFILSMLIAMLAPSATAAAVVAALTCTTEASAFLSPAPAWSTAGPAGSSTFARRCKGSPAQSAPAPASTSVRIASQAVIPAARRRSSSSSLHAALRPAGPAPNSRRGQGQGYHPLVMMASSSPMEEYTSRRGLVFPTDKEEGWFDSATVGSPRVHRCEIEERKKKTVLVDCI